MLGSSRRIAALALNTYREAVRARLLLGLFALALATALYSIAVGEFALKNASRVVADLGAASISIYAIVVAVIIGATSLYRELEQKTIFPILARPIRRAEYVVGKYAGTLLTLRNPDTLRLDLEGRVDLGTVFAFDRPEVELVGLVVNALGTEAPTLLSAKTSALNASSPSRRIRASSPPCTKPKSATIGSAKAGG